MTDDLVKRLGDACRGGDTCKCSLNEAADRIEALERGRETLVQAHDAMVEILRQSGRKRIAAEARLAECEARLSKAVEALREIAADDFADVDGIMAFCSAVLAEIEGGKKDE